MPLLRSLVVKGCLTESDFLNDFRPIDTKQKKIKNIFSSGNLLLKPTVMCFERRTSDH